MEFIKDYWLAALLSLIFCMITILVYNRARKEYSGGKIAAAINMILVFLIILFIADLIDYFSHFLFPMGKDTLLIVKITLRLTAACVLFFGGLRFFAGQQADAESMGPTFRPEPVTAGPDPTLPSEAAYSGRGSTVVLERPVAPAAETPAVKPTLGRYEILEQAGRGAMGVVYKARDPRLNRIIAIKTIRFADDVDDDQLEGLKNQFYHEAKVVGELSHPNIVSVYDVGEDLGLDLSFLAMEYLEGESLDRFVRPDRLLPLDRCIAVTIQVCDALAYAHGCGIVHRDIKPANIVLLKNGQIKVADFGVARVAMGSKTRTGTIKGTPYYMSPEQTKGLEVTGASDIFSLGVVFYQLLTGKLPFYGENLSSVMYQITTVAPEPPMTFNPEISSAVAEILDRALAKEIAVRYETASQMGDDLRRLG